MTIAERRAQPFLSAEGLHKRYGATVALRDASIAIQSGEVHGLLGENGSGKSTLLKILSGQIAPDSGELSMGDGPVRFSSPVDALASGIAVVTQETSLALDLTVAENITMGGRAARRWYGMDWRGTERRAKAILDRLGIDLDPRAVVGQQRPDVQQLVEIARALSFDARLLILDEPTSSLTDDETQALFRVVRALSADGVAIVFVSHRMRETFELVQSITILRDGGTVVSGPVEGFTPDQVIDLMVGGEWTPHQRAPRSSPGSADDHVLRVRDLRVPGKVAVASLEVGRGEIVGIAGLVGSGRSELLAAIIGLHPNVEGSVLTRRGGIGRPTVARALKAGIAYVPPDRKALGLVMDLTVRENLLMSATSPRRRWSRPSRRREGRLVGAMMRDWMIRARAAEVTVGSLSGGNQQKVLLGKALATRPDVVLLDEPTRGVDVAAKSEIYRLLTALRDEGTGIVVSSSETPELLELCDRILVLYRGQQASWLVGDARNEAEITRQAMGAS